MLVFPIAQTHTKSTEVWSAQVLATQQADTCHNSSDDEHCSADLSLAAVPVRQQVILSVYVPV